MRPEFFEDLRFPKTKTGLVIPLRRSVIVIPASTTKIGAKLESSKVGIYFRNESDEGLAVTYIDPAELPFLRTELNTKYKM